MPILVEVNTFIDVTDVTYEQCWFKNTASWTPLVAGVNRGATLNDDSVLCGSASLQSICGPSPPHLVT